MTEPTPPAPIRKRRTSKIAGVEHQVSTLLPQLKTIAIANVALTLTCAAVIAALLLGRG